MGFASTYLETRTLFPQLIKEAPDKKTGITAVVPAFDEPEITTLLDSLINCNEPDCKVEVIVIVNSPLHSSIESQENNRKSISEIETWKKQNINTFFRLFLVDKTNCPIKEWGVGLARKTGMDEAIRRFNNLDKPDGVIINLDADCTVEKNYFRAIYEELASRKERSACSVYFEHPLSGNKFPENVFRSIALYELHLRYYYQGLKFTGFPYAYHTVGSALAVKAMPYIKCGGMNRRQAGEDFYFVQKLLPAGGYFSLNTTTVYPSPRESFRVPFGTGVVVSKLLESRETTLPSYNLQSFKELQDLFSKIDKLFHCSTDDLLNLFGSLPQGIQLFIKDDEWVNKLNEIKANTSSLHSFHKRFFNWFNMFRIVKYLNHSHSRIFKKTPVTESAVELLDILGNNFRSDDPREILDFYRRLEKVV